MRVVDLHVLDAERLELLLRLVGGPQRLALLLQARDGGDAHHVPLARRLQAVRVEHQVEGLVPGNLDEVEGHLPLHVVGRHDVEAAHVGQDSQHVLKVGVLEIERDALTGKVVLADQLPCAGLLRLRTGRLRRLRLSRSRSRLRLGRGGRARMGRDHGWVRRGRRRVGCQFLADRLFHDRRGQRCLWHRARRRSRRSDLGDQSLSLLTHGARAWRLAEVDHDAERLAARGRPHPRYQVVGEGEAGDGRCQLRVGPLQVDHQPRRRGEHELSHAIRRARELDREPAGRASGFDPYVAHRQSVRPDRRPIGHAVTGDRCGIPFRMLEGP